LKRQKGSGRGLLIFTATIKGNNQRGKALGFGVYPNFLAHSASGSFCHALTPEFAALKAATWAAFIRRNALTPLEMAATLDAIRAFAWPVMEAALNGMTFTEHWTPARDWQPEE